MDEGLRILAEVRRQVGVPVLTDVHAIDEVATVARGRRRAADARVPLPADRFHPGGRARRQAGEHQEGPVPRARGHAAGRREGEGGERRRQHPGVRARRIVRLPQPRLRHALARDHARRRAARSCSTRRIRCSCPAGRARRPAASANSCRCWRARPSPRALRACSWRRIPIPRRRLSDGPNAWPLRRMRALLETLKELDAAVKRAGFPEHELMETR